MKYILILSALTLFGISSCVDYGYDYTYELTNNSDSQIKIDLKTSSGIDSSYEVAVNETKILFVTDHGLEDSDGPYFADVIYDLDEFIVTKNDTLISKKNYRDSSSWNYKNGLYKAVITNEEFK